MGFKVEFIWECAWGKNPIPTQPRSPTSEIEIKDGIMNKEIFGIVQCSLKVPEHLEEYFSEFPFSKVWYHN